MSDQAAPDPRTPWRRFLWVGLALLALVGLGMLLFWNTFKGLHSINGLSSRDPATQREMRAALRTSTDPKTDERLLDALADGDRSFDVRMACADLLLERNRLTAVEGLARRGDLMTRAVILTRLSRESFFKNEVLPDPAFQVEATVRAWLADATLEHRSDAIRLALALELPGAMEHIRPLLSRVAAEGAGREDANMVLIGAAEAVARFKDCGSAEQVALLADTDPDIHVRLRTLEVLERLTVGVMGSEPVCPGALSEARMAAIVARTLDAKGDADFTRNMRIKGLGMLERHPAWLPPLAARVRALLEGDGNGAERRAALSALVVGRDASIGAELPRFIHDRDYEVRSTAVQVADQVPDLVAGGLWVGILRDESDPRAREALRQAHLRLKLAAGSYVILPESLKAISHEPAKQEIAVNEFLDEQLRTGQALGLSREAWAEAWFRWFAGTQHVEGAALEQALIARKAFRAAMSRDDLPAARAALEGAPVGDGSVFLYEQGWLAAKSQ